MIIKNDNKRHYERKKKMKKFDLVMKRAEIRYRDRARIKAGCTLYGEPDRIASFDTLEEAKKELEKYQTSVRELKKGVLYYLVEEYMLELNEYTEEGEFKAGGEVLAISQMAGF